MPQRLPSKKDVTLALLQSSFSVFIHLDPRKERVSVPPQFRRQAHLILEIGMNMPVPIKDLDVDDEGITCTLSFSRTPHWCRLPWDAVFSVVGQDQRGMVWPDDIPADSQFRFGRAPAAEAPKKPKLAAVREVPAEATDTSETEVAAKQTPPTDTATTATAVAEEQETSDRPEPAADAASEPAPLREAAQVSEGDQDESEGAEPKPKARKLPPYLRVVK